MRDACFGEIADLGSSCLNPRHTHARRPGDRIVESQNVIWSLLVCLQARGVAREGQGIQGLGSRLPKQFFSQLGVVSSQLGWPFEVRVHG